MRTLWLAWLLAASLPALAQQTEGPAMTAEQQTLFAEARKDFSEQHPELALAKMKQLHAMLPEDRTITDGTVETALAAGDDAYALQLLVPWVAKHAEDTFALEMLARAYAETGNAAKRDQTIAAVLNLHETSADGSFRRADRFLVERVALASGHLDIFYALVPFSGYHISMLGRQVDAKNVLVRQITLESDDFDQPLFAKEHPELAAKGVRRFSMDTYSAGEVGPDGTRTQIQGLIGFFDGQPSYDEVKAWVVRVAGGGVPPLATRSGLPAGK